MKKKGVLLAYIWKYKIPYLLGLLTLLMVDYVNLFIPQITGEITDGLASFTLDLNGVFQLILSLLGVALLITLGRVFWRVFIFGTSRKIENELRNDLFSKLEELSQTYFNTHKTGDLMTHFTNDLEALRNSIGPAVISSFDAIVMTALVLYQMMVYVDFKLTLLTLIPMSLIAIGGYYFGEEFERRFAKKQDAFAKLSDHVQESITGERVIKAFVQEEKQDKAFQKVNDYNKKMNMRVVKLMATFMPLMDFIIGISYVITIIYGGYLALTAQITLGRFVAFNQYLGMLIWPMIALGDSITSFSQGRAAIGRINQVFDEIPDIVDDEHPLDIKELYGDISIRHLSFSYGDEFQDALSDLSIEIKRGETLAILGRTGDGKTTLVNLLLRLYDISEGEILFDGHDIKKIPLHVLRSSIAYVPQDSYLFSDTLERNISFGKRSATHEEVVEVCKMACVHDNIIDFPEGYETVVGERGVTLSGGQKQRCAIARALLKDSPILILDDSLSAVDTDTEDQILENLKKKRKDKTTIMIAHRISTVKNADHILILEEGKKAEYGTFDELMALGGIFKEMYDKQQLEKQLSAE
ncbi:ABC transporter ATP-binding protein [Traorella massiliensis]|uniref:ABC transporter ATP-binding protein n=2 Tax=Traorella massiliensis TaxID=1903263 RepID=UPI0008F8775E|nr:ABC transporter ATP-binding protein [Traorella massiliensis]